ncbi:hypothetical protein PSHT_12484 [Puccinia striiformis]|uniref:Essential protein Yae1 N-terminal domain-containing protein n=1 Tax=Puccinia striiformis TaxID=27350 RepID=A0A2S4UWD7_9BASI|nr:hypothetical protein PSHT_12484 [Puccinia striiformis]
MKASPLIGTWHLSGPSGHTLINDGLTRLTQSPGRANEAGIESIPMGDFIKLTRVIHFRFFDAGHQLGVRDGREAGKLEGFQLGEKEGFKLWEELAYYLGQAQIWGATQDNTGKLNAKIQTLISLIEAFPTQNPPESDGAEFLSQLNNIRASYRMCCANLGIRPRIREAAGNSL